VRRQQHWSAPRRKASGKLACEHTKNRVEANAQSEPIDAEWGTNVLHAVSVEVTLSEDNWKGKRHQEADGDLRSAVMHVGRA